MVDGEGTLLHSKTHSGVNGRRLGWLLRVIASGRGYEVGQTVKMEVIDGVILTQWNNEGMHQIVVRVYQREYDSGYSG